MSLPGVYPAFSIATTIDSSAARLLARFGANPPSSPTAVGDEGGFAPNLASNRAALESIVVAIEKAGYTPGKDIYLALDCAASEFYHDGRYVLSGEGREFSSEEFVGYLEGLRGTLRTLRY